LGSTPAGNWTTSSVSEQAFMHHEAIEGHHKYDDRRGIRIIGAGIFGAPANQPVIGIPLRYNLPTFDPRTGEMTVKSRKKEKPKGGGRDSIVLGPRFSAGFVSARGLIRVDPMKRCGRDNRRQGDKSRAQANMKPKNTICLVQADSVTPK
jgi:hypothetical protein